MEGIQTTEENEVDYQMRNIAKRSYASSVITRESRISLTHSISNKIPL